MAHLIVVCPRAGTGVPFDPADLRRCAAAIAPDNIEPHDPLIHAEGGLLVGVVNPVAGIPVNGGSVCLGRLFGPSDGWWRLGAEAPDGNYAIVRTDERAIELLTDILATRPVWYVQTERVFLASSSQRALVMLLRSFELEHEAVTWMLACGHLGAMSWDRRLRRMPGDCRLTLDRKSWQMQLDLRPADREPHPLSDEDHVTLLREAIIGTCESLDLCEREWLLTLSGGLDSRVLLMALLESGKSPRCVTWGLKSSQANRRTDAWVASELASALGIQHHYYSTDAAPGSVEVAVHRFLTVGEGQNCLQYEPYADGMAMWKAFFESGVCGVVRGDEPGLGYYLRQASQMQVRRRMQIVLVSDYPRDHPIRRLGLAEQHLNEGFSPHPGESLMSWDDRIYEELEYPSIMAPLNSLKSGFVEVVNPLQSRRVTEAARRLPDRMRPHRSALQRAALPIGFHLPFAERGAEARGSAFIRHGPFTAAMREALCAADAETVLERYALDLVVDGLTGDVVRSPRAPFGKRAVKAAVPRWLIDRVRPVWPLSLDGHKLAFRTYVAVRMAQMLASDAAALAGGRSMSDGLAPARTGGEWSRHRVHREDVNGRCLRVVRGRRDA